MTLKKIEDMNHYEVLNINKSASQQEIEKAYIASKAAFQRNSLAHYNLVSEKEREEMVTRIEKAYLVLSHPKKRKRYDLKIFNYKADSKEPSFFRQTTQRLVIEDGEKKSFWAKIKKFLFLKSD
jgi:DnaJ-class molecular chaperone